MGNDIVPTFFKIDDPIAAAKKLIENKRTLRITNQTNISPCKGCFLLKEQAWMAKDHIHGIAISGFLHCNLACTYCVTYQHDPSDRGVPTLETLKAWYGIGIIRSGSYIDMGGGESTLHREFDDIAAFAFEHGITMHVYTNAVGVSKSLLIGLRGGLANAIISVDAGTAETYRRIKKKDVLHRVWDSITEYVSAAPEAVFVKYIMMDSNRSKLEIDAFLAQARKSGVVRLMPSVNVFQNHQSAGNLSDPMKRSLAYMLKHGRSIGKPTLAETISPQAQAEIETLSHLDDDMLMGDSTRSNWRGQLELAFSNSAVFRDRARSIIAERDSFVIQYPAPIVETSPYQFLQSAIDDARAAGAILNDVKDGNGKSIGLEISF